MKALINPLLLLICIVLLAFGSQSPEHEQMWDYLPWVLGLCATAFCVNGVLALSRALSHRPALLSVGWSVVFIVFGSVTWALAPTKGDDSLSAAERQEMQARVKAWRAGGDPYAVDDNGDSLLLLAAGLGREDVLKSLLDDKDSLAQRADDYARAAHRAAERNRAGSLRLMLGAGLPADARAEGMNALHVAALYKAQRAAAVLLEHGADANAADALEGSTPLHHAVMADDAAMVALLLQHGADPKKADAEGREAASYARSEAVEAALRGEEVAR